MQGWCVAKLGLPSLVVTLAGLIGFRGAARVLVEDRSFGDFPAWFDDLGQDDLIGPLPFALIVFFVGIVVGGVVLGRTAFGRRMYVIGDNADVARYAGVNVGAMQASGCSPRPGPSPGSPACCTPPVTGRCAATSAKASSSTSSRWCCSAA